MKANSLSVITRLLFTSTHLAPAFALKGLFGDGRFTSPQQECVYNYAKQLDSLGKYPKPWTKHSQHLGGFLRQLPYHNFDWNGSYNTQDIVLGVGFGTTATRSFETALKLLGLEGDHYGKDAYFVANYVLGRVDKDGHINSTKCKDKLRTMFPGRRPAGPDEGFPKRWSYTGDYLLDTPVAELFLDFFVTYPNARYVLTNRNAKEWVHARRINHDQRELAPKQEPCREWMMHFSDEALESMFNWHSELVRCMVPKDRLLEINVWEDSRQRQKDFMTTLETFVKNNRTRRLSKPTFPTHRDPRPNLKLALKSMGGQPDEACTSEQDVASAFQNRSLKGSALMLAGGTYTVSVTSSQIGLLMHDAALRDCEVVVETGASSSDSGASIRPRVQWALHPEDE